MADESASVALTDSAPASERYDAQVDFMKAQGTGALAAELLPAEDIRPVIDHINQLWEDQRLAKAARGNLIQGPWKKPNRDGAQSVILDNWQVTSQGDYWDRPGLLGFDSMRAMVEQTPILNSIVMTRVRQVLRFCRPATDQSGAGFRLVHVDPNAELSEALQDQALKLQGFMINCGWEANPRRRKQLKRDSFSQFMAKSVRDTLTMDACPIETEFKRAKSLGLDGFYAVDGATIRLCTEQGYQGDDEFFAVQVIQGTIRTAYTYEDLVYEVRNPRSDVTAAGYGYSETEMLIRIVTMILNTTEYNGSFFDKNSIPRGMLNLVGNYDQGDLAAFKRYWNAMLRGAGNAHNMPILVAKDGESKSEFVEIGGQLNEMAFGKWLTFLTSIACAIYGVAPEEISMESYAADKSSLSGSDTGEKLVSANDKGLRPLLGFYENVFSDFIVQEFSEQLMFRFVGLDQEDEDKRFEMTKLVTTWNEGRQQIGLDAIDGPLGDAPLNSVLLQPWLVENDVGQPEQPSEDFGDPDDAAAADAEQTGAAPADVDDEAAAGGEDGKPDFGEGSDEPMAKAMSEADYGLPPIYALEV